MLRVKTDTHIDTITAPKAPQLRRLFHRAVIEDFSYFPRQYQMQVLRENSLPRLMVATLRPARIMLGAWQDSRMLGYILGTTNGNASGKIYWLYVSPESRGQQLGQRLLDRLIEVMQQRQMERVKLVTHDYDGYYSKYGFQTERVDNVYGVDVKVMSYEWANQ
jgi:ribosomal protein S18 acetylase RimI-like enzyme